MINFQYSRAADVTDAVRQIAAEPGAKFVAGGTNLIDLMKEEVERPSRLIDISRLPLNTVEATADGGVRIGALVPNSDFAHHPLIAQRYPMLASAILAGASAQLRNMASTGGNLLQAPAAITSTTRRRLAISAFRAAAARPSMGSIACTRSSAPANPVSQHIHPTCAWRLRHWLPLFGWRAPEANARLRSRIFIACRAIRRSAIQIWAPTRSSLRSSCRPKASPKATPI